MRFEILILAATVFFIANTYYDGKYVQILKSWKKYYQMIGIGFLGISAYAYIKKYPGNSKSFLQSANGIIKYMPIDKEAGDFLTPILDMTKNSIHGTSSISNYSPQQKRMLSSGGNTTKRSVSETKKNM